jgi:hypothetical protein
MLATDLNKYFDVLRRFVTRWRAETVAQISRFCFGRGSIAGFVFHYGNLPFTLENDGKRTTQ